MKKILIINLAVMIALCGIAFAGNLEPGAAPAPTMKTLDQIPPTWSQKLQCDATACPRFELVLDGVGVLDKETGLVWEKTPSMGSTQQLSGVVWTTGLIPTGAIDKCYMLYYIGGRGGWHLPTFAQLNSLRDGGQALPQGHPFVNVQSNFYWTSTKLAANTDLVYFIHFGTNATQLLNITTQTTYTPSVWCVRSANSYDGY